MKARYLISDDDSEIVDCLFGFLANKDNQMKTQKPVIDCLVWGHLAQSESKKPFSWRLKFLGKKSPCLGVLLIYLITHWATLKYSQWERMPKLT